MDYIVQKTQRKLKLKKKDAPIPISVKSIHKQKLKYFEDLQNSLPKKRELFLKTRDRILEKEIKDIENMVEETDYYFKVAKILDKYFSLENENTETDNSKKIEIVRDYYQALDIDLPREFSPDLNIYPDKCKLCGNETNVVLSEEDGNTCGDCGYVLDAKNITDTLSYKDRQTVEHVTIMDYKRIDYFKQWLSQIQAKDSVSVPREVIDEVLVQLKTERNLCSNLSKLNTATVKRILKKTNNSKYYDHIPHIINNINKIEPLRIPDYIEQKMIAMFQEIQEPWEKLKTKERKNFLSYPYVIYKFCQILGLKEYLSYFPLLKSREKLYKQDIIWKRITTYLQENASKNHILEDVTWNFYASV